MRVILVNLAYETSFGSSEELIRTYVTLRGFAEALADREVDVQVVQRFREDERLSSGGATYHLVADRRQPLLPSWQVSRPALEMIQELASGQQRSVVHLNGIVFPRFQSLLGAGLASETPLVVQHHAERPRRRIVRWLQKRAQRWVDGYFFVSREQVAEWTSADVIPSDATVYEVMECSSDVAFEPQESAQSRTGLTGQPVLFWAGNLTQNKDPLTILRGFRLVLAKQEQARLYMAFRSAPLLDEVENMIHADAALDGAVTLLGQIEYEEIGPYFSSADVFVQGSRREGSGIAVLDALATGAFPVITDIPAFRKITRDATVGKLFPPGDHQAFTDAVAEALSDPYRPNREQIRQFFCDNWTFSKIAEEAHRAYLELSAD